MASLVLLITNPTCYDCTVDLTVTKLQPALPSSRKVILRYLWRSILNLAGIWFVGDKKDPNTHLYIYIYIILLSLFSCLSSVRKTRVRRSCNIKTWVWLFEFGPNKYIYIFIKKRIFYPIAYYTFWFGIKE